MPTVVVNLYKSEFDVYIGRPGKGQDGYFGNPFPLLDKSDEGRRECLEKFKAYFLDRVEKDVEFRQKVLTLRNKRLGCFCSPKLCHGTIIAEFVDSQPEDT